MSKTKFAVPVQWSMTGWIEVEAESKEEALHEVKKNLDVYELPIDIYPGQNVEYIEDSFELICDDEEEMLTYIEETR